jgi:hypothetical protein
MQPPTHPSLYQETRDPEPAVTGSAGFYGYYGDGCVLINPGGGVDFSVTTTSSLYPNRLRVFFPDGSSHVLFLTNLTTPTNPTVGDGWLGMDWTGKRTGCGTPGGPSQQLIPFPLHYITQDGTFLRVTVTGEDAASVSPIWSIPYDRPAPLAMHLIKRSCIGRSIRLDRDKLDDT